MEPSKEWITDLDDYIKWITDPVDDYINMDDYSLKKMFDYLCRCSSHILVRSLILDDAEKKGIIDANTRKDIGDLFRKLCKGESSSEDIFQQFRTLVTTSLTRTDFTRLYKQMDPDPDFLVSYIYETSEEKFSLRSSDHVVLEMKKSAAMSQSVVLGDYFDFTRYAGLNDKDEIPVQVPSLVLPKIISFCNKNHKFNSIIEGAVEQLKGAVNLLKGTVNDYMDWITSFVKSNKPLFSHLHQAADYLHIPALLELTSMALGDMKKSSVEVISDWYAGLSIPRMLSPLGIHAYSTLSQLDFFS